MKEILKPSFIVTGASASGKTTLVEHAISDGYNHIPTSTTRKQRPGEVEGIHNIFVDKERFVSDFKNNLYLEDSLDFAYMPSIDTYYGSQAAQTELLEKDGYCSSPVSITIARKIISMCDTNWVHLICDDNDRYNRLKRRGISDEEIEKRMTFGDSLEIPNEAKVFNTSKLATSSLYYYVKQLGVNRK